MGGLFNKNDVITRKDLLTREDVRKEIEDYFLEKENYDMLTNPQALSNAETFEPRYPVMEAWIASVSDDKKTAEVTIPYHLGETNETLTAILSAEIMAWCIAWEKPAKYYSTVFESPIYGKLSVNGDNFQTTIPTIALSTCVVAGAGALIPPIAGCTVSGTAVPSPPVTKVEPAKYMFSGDYDKMGSSIQTDQDKFYQQPRVSGLFPFNAIKEDWRKDKPFLQGGDKVAVIFLNGDPDKAFITQIIAFADDN